MILPSQSQNGEDQSLPPPSYQDSVPSSQLTPNERPTAALYAPSLSSRFRPSNENERGSTSRLNSPNEKVGFPEPDISTGNAYSEPPPLPPKDKEKEVLRDGPGQRALDAFSSMVWGTSPTASTSRSPIPSGSTSNIRDPLNPSPSAFTRPTPKHYAYLPFQAMSMLSISSNLADGFPTIPPPINPEDERQVGKANSQHPFVSHDVTEEDWLGFLIGLKTVVSSSNQSQKSFLAKLFLSEMSERDQRKRAVHFVDSWNHYFFHPRRLTVVLAHGRKVFNGASGNHLHRRHSIGSERGRDIHHSHKKGHKHRSHSTDSSSSSSSSESSISSTASEPDEMPVPHPRTDYGSEKGFGGPVPWANRGLGRGGGGFGGPPQPGFYGGRGRGWCPPGPSVAVHPIHRPSCGPPGCGGPRGSHSHREQKLAWKVEKRAWRVEKRAAKREYRLAKRSMRHERRQHRRAAKEMRYHGGKTTHKRDQPWKLIITFHGARRDSVQL